MDCLKNIQGLYSPQITFARTTSRLHSACFARVPKR